VARRAPLFAVGAGPRASPPRPPPPPAGRSRRSTGCSRSRRVKAENKPSDKERHRRTKSQIERDYLLGGYRNHLVAIGQSAFTDKALDLLTKDKLVDLVEDGKKAKANIDSLLGRLRQRDSA
jgi:hypothetical protein